MSHATALGTALTLLFLGCGQGDPRAPAGKASSGQAPASAGEAARTSREPLRRLATPLHRLTEGLGPYRLRLDATLRMSIPGSAPRFVKQDLTVQAGAKGAFHAVKNTHEQFGHEVIFHDGWIYSRPRYSKFIRRRATTAEAAALLDRLASHMPAYLGLLGPSLTATAKGSEVVSGRQADRVALALAPKADSGPPAVRSGAQARRWRRTVQVKQVSGSALLDRRSGVPLAVDLKAAWSFNPPRAAATLPPGGIPAMLDETTRGDMTLSLRLRLEVPGQAGAIVPPPEDQTVSRVRRRRLELERQLLTGEVPVPQDWSKEP